MLALSIMSKDCYNCSICWENNAWLAPRSLPPPRKRKEKSFAKMLLLKFLFSPGTLQELLQSSTSMAVQEVSCDDRIFAAIWKLLVPGDLHHLLLTLHLILTGESGLSLCHGAQGGDGVSRLHKSTPHAHGWGGKRKHVDLISGR